MSVINFSDSQVKEMSEPGTVIGQLTTEDEDLDQTHTYTLMDNAGGRVLLNGTTLQVRLQKNCLKMNSLMACQSNTF